MFGIIFFNHFEHQYHWIYHNSTTMTVIKTLCSLDVFGSGMMDFHLGNIHIDDNNNQAGILFMSWTHFILLSVSGSTHVKGHTSDSSGLNVDSIFSSDIFISDHRCVFLFCYHVSSHILNSSTADTFLDKFTLFLPSSDDVDHLMKLFTAHCLSILN